MARLLPNRMSVRPTRKNRPRAMNIDWSRTAPREWLISFPIVEFRLGIDQPMAANSPLFSNEGSRIKLDATSDSTGMASRGAEKPAVEQTIGLLHELNESDDSEQFQNGFTGSADKFVCRTEFHEAQVAMPHG